ncbi:MAG TPA: hypothetical protein VER55_03090, partial [Ardenticatenaceae bacterium]|nr:hypothetical protein [Ardenticatenaceae bacterium]
MKLRMSALLLLVALLSGLTTLSGRRAYGQDPGTTTPNAGQGEYAAMSADGRYVAFESAAADVVSSDMNGVRDVFVHDRESGETRRVSVASDGSEAD